MQRVDARLGGDLDELGGDLRRLLVVAGSQEVDERMGQRVRLAAFAGRDQRELHLVEQILQAFLVDEAGIVPGAAVPDAGLAGGDFLPPLVARHADMVLLGDAGSNRSAKYW